MIINVITRIPNSDMSYMYFRVTYLEHMLSALCHYYSISLNMNRTQDRPVFFWMCLPIGSKTSCGLLFIVHYRRFYHSSSCLPFTALCVLNDDDDCVLLEICRPSLRFD